MVISRLFGAIRNPAQLVVGSFVALIAIGTGLLHLPFATETADHPALSDSLFWSTSAVTVTGLGSTDVATFSLFGELVLLGLIQIGGFGIMTIGSVLGLVASKRVGLRQRMLAQTEIGAVDIGELRTLIMAIARITIFVEASIAVILFVGFATHDDISLVRAAYSGLFHAISAFNNAGISLNSDNLIGFAGDWFVLFPVSVAFMTGGLGFPILIELKNRVRPRDWSLHAKITLMMTSILIVIGPLVVLVAEWTNPATMGSFGVWDKLQGAWFQGVSPRTAGFNSVDIGALREPTITVMSALMFIGAGPASTGGGIKVTSFAVLGYAIWAEVRGHNDVTAFRRRLPPSVIRQSLAISLLGVAVVFGTAVALEAMTSLTLNDTLFEATSAFGTVGLSTGITGALPTAGHLLLVVVMLAGRVGPITLITALALRSNHRAYRFAEERPIIG